MSEPPRLAPPSCAGTAVPAGRSSAAFGTRFFILASLGFVWLGPAWASAKFIYLMVLWDALIVALWAWDLLRVLPPPDRIEIRRSWPAAPRLATPGRVELHARCADTVAGELQMTLVDDVPASFCRTPPALEATVSAGRPETVSYDILPTERGDFPLGSVFIRYRGRLGLAERRAVVDLSQTARVYPDLEGAQRHTIHLIRSRQIDRERRIKRRYGTGREFESLREYRPGDQWRDICWTATARRGKMITKTYQTERNQAVWLVLDTGRLLRARVMGLTKLDHAVAAALSLAQVALYSGDRIGLLAYGRRPQQRLGAGRGSSHLRALVERLALVRAEGAEADHGRAARVLLEAQKHRSLVVWLTDLAETASEPEVIESASRISARHQVLFVAIGQPEIQELVAQAPESTTQMYRYVAALEMIERRDLLLRRLRERGAMALEVDPGGLSTALVNKYLEVKERSLI